MANQPVFYKKLMLHSLFTSIEKGLSLLEFVLILVLIVVGIIGALGIFGDTLLVIYERFIAGFS